MNVTQMLLEEFGPMTAREIAAASVMHGVPMTEQAAKLVCDEMEKQGKIVITYAVPRA